MVAPVPSVSRTGGSADALGDTGRSPSIPAGAAAAVDEHVTQVADALIRGAGIRCAYSAST